MTAQKPAHTPTPDQPLQPARKSLSDAISALIDPRLHHRDGRNHWLSPRYHELREAIDAQTGLGHGRTESKAPLWVAALATLMDIDALATKHEPHWPISECDDYPTVQRLRVIDSRKWRPQDTDTVQKLANDITKLVADLDQLFALPPKFLQDPCPECHAKTAYRTTEGERLRGPALRIAINGPDDCSATCGNCGEHWPRERLEWLGRLLNCPRIEGAIEHD